MRLLFSLVLLFWTSSCAVFQASAYSKSPIKWEIQYCYKGPNPNKCYLNSKLLLDKVSYPEYAFCLRIWGQKTYWISDRSLAGGNDLLSNTEYLVMVLLKAASHAHTPPFHGIPETANIQHVIHTKAPHWSKYQAKPQSTPSSLLPQPWRERDSDFPPSTTREQAK